MKILSISIRNFRLHADTDVTFPPEGILGIIGTNEAGKSTILEAVAWALFGGDATRGTRSGIRWFGAASRQTASVTLRFEVGGRVYRIERGETSARVYDETTALMIVDGTAAVNGHVPVLLGMTHAEFSASFLVRQKDVARLGSMLPTERVGFIRSLMGMGKIDAALKVCRAAKSALSQEMDGLIRGLGERLPLEEAVEGARHELAIAARADVDAKDALREAERAMAEKLVAAQGSNERKAQHDAYARDLKQGEAAVEHAKVEVDRLEVKLAKVGGAKERIALVEPKLQRIPGIRGEREAMLTAQAAASERATLLAREAELVETVDGPDGLVERIRDAEAQVHAYDRVADVEASRAAKDAEARLLALREARRQQRALLLAEAERHEREAKRHDRRIRAIEEAGEHGDCPTCTRTLGDAYTIVLEALKEQEAESVEAAEECRTGAADLTDPSDDELEAEAERNACAEEAERYRILREDAERAGKVASERKAELEKTERSLGEVRAKLVKLPEVDFDSETLAALDAELEHLEVMDRRLEGDRALVAQEEEARALLQERRDMLERADAQVATANQGLLDLAFDAQEHARIVAEAEAARKATEDARVALARAEEASRGAYARRDAAEAALQDYDTRAVRLQEVQEDHLLHERTAARLADFRVAIAATIRPEMEELMSGFVQLLTDGRHEAVTLTEQFDAVLHEAGVAVEVVSGGTEDIAALAMRLALSQMIAERAGHPLSLLILDEPFGSLDETRRGNVLTLIRRLRGVFSQVVVISHVAETRDAVDHVVELEYDEEGGRARVVTAPEVKSALAEAVA